MDSTEEHIIKLDGRTLICFTDEDEVLKTSLDTGSFIIEVTVKSKLGAVKAVEDYFRKNPGIGIGRRKN